ncbi:hypothetical protein MJ923_15230 [Shewanella sp. 3B26]|uniref:TonB-dependent receptor n=1 Tax=Shewanella zhuhaiensis TaxID=2919576 RepID=A0AAJ1BIX7_9GAMM|nr:hypothetical protein [Shewanella zhuhaiensis]MCH4295660.1 hypothetical protein [Shewanella zhuhaiensis]
MKHTPALVSCLLAGCACFAAWAEELPAQTVTPFFTELLGINSPTVLPLQPLGSLAGKASIMGESRFFQSDSRENTPGLNGIDLALAPFAAPGVWLDAGRFGVDGLDLCGLSAEQCANELKSDYWLSPAGQGSDGLGLEARDDKTAALRAALQSSNEALDMGFRGSYLQQKADDSRLDDAKDTELFIALGASSLPGAKNKQRTELGWLYQDSSVPLSAAALTVSRERQRLHLTHYAGVVGGTGSSQRTNIRSNSIQSSTRTDLFWQESRIDFTALAAAPSNTEADNSLLGAAGPSSALIDGPKDTAAAAVQGINADNFIGGFVGDVRYQTMGIQSESIDSYGKHSLSYRLSYQHDSADYKGSMLVESAAGTNPEVANVEISDSASVLTLGLKARLDFAWLDVAAQASWLRADTERVRTERAGTERISNEPAGGEAGTDFSMDSSSEGWRYGLGLLFADDSIGLWGRHGFTPPAPGNAEALAQTWDGINLDGNWAMGSFSLKGQLWARDYDNLHLDCTELEDCPGLKGMHQLNVADVSARGFGLSASWLGEFGALSVPLVVGVEENRSEFDSAQCLVAASRCYNSGDRLPWQPSRQLSMALGLSAGEWSLSFTGREITYPEGDMSRLDAALSWQHGAHGVYLRADNLAADDLPSKVADFGPRGGEVLFSLGYRWHG